MKMCKSFVVLNVGKAAFNPVTGKFTLGEGSGYTVLFYTTYEGAVAKAEEFARSGYIGLIYEAKDFRQIQPVPVVVERVICCD